MTDIVARLRNAYLSTGANYVQEAADEIERLRDELQMAKDAALEDNEIERLHADNQAAVRAYAAEINEAKAESERLRAAFEEARDVWETRVADMMSLEDEKNGYINEVGDILGQAQDGETLFGAARRAISEIEQLRKDKRELTAQLRHIRTHLYAATVQRSPADDKIIADHVEQAYLRANEVIKTMETKE